MFKDNDLNKLYVKLSRETSEDKLVWKIVLSKDFIALTEANEDRIGAVYTCDYKGKKLAIYLRKYKHFFDDVEWAWTEEPQLAIVTDNYEVLWKSRYCDSTLINLYEIVSRQGSGFNDLIDDLIP
ncbi:TPA: hypothetical protein PCX98_004362 [Klebsiella aerogenes]|uniref:Uncharacterized protein n=1 Tax=Klebsiella aerogenes (strain ATCC 13048 / DSM 30053 / CCUG 1429 / JCM 1235 / KCTC 2190 / NBRC 13534 / NCIMB 10102 / NCTC 10006 / CDC 819-56) TaxID=1028307 RepID=A0A0H3FY55_KLEAK|nr:hypothetical protein [Klebsiella aerogenes]AEG99327.1 hypothetical protein EAE_22140 [Klebsiella aerogenes KCTC 2190]MEC4761121.1 hypothetical protein [Klebsiella aerogenes]QEU17888.1 hypothetical protein FOB49_04265 [Klebsiella aerogenes]QXB08304.1 hypothetical protein I6L72_14380 [Klebsiella aerogenes]RFP76707.1 hypothetical protein D0N43_02650 [Klebsiella aerogenes]